MTESLVADTPINLLDLVDDGPRPDAAPGIRPRRVYIETYGCQMNVADSELMAGILTRQGYDAATGPEDADVILINTCAVRERAEERVLGRAATLNGHKKERPDVLLGICGCMAEHLRETIHERAPFVDLIIGPAAYRRLPALIEQAAGAEEDELAIDVRLDKAETYEGLTPLRRDGVNGWITIQRGCDQFCTFCIVPFTRGRERGVPPREILRQARELVAQGARSVTLLGQTVNSYRYEDVDFADLLRAVAQVEGVERIRFTSPYPVDFTPKLIEVMASEPRVCPYIHLPVQSGSDRMLKEMRRGHTIAEYRQLVADLRAAIPNLALSTDIIVGFPGETDEDYQRTVELIEEIRYDFAYLFKYSERSGTYAHKKLPDDVPEAVKGSRLSRLIEIQEAICLEKTTPYVGRIVQVLIAGESRKSEHDWVGKTDTFKTTIMPKVPGSEVGQIVSVQVEEVTSHTLKGHIVTRDESITS